MSILIQRSLSGGEIAPALRSRSDIAKYQSGLRTCRNYIVQKSGGAASRPGTRFVGEVKDSTKKVSFVPFVFNVDQTYDIELGDLYMRFVKNGTYIRETPKAINGITNAVPATVTSIAHGFSNGDEVYITGVSGMTELNGRTFKVTNVTADTFGLLYMDNVTSVNSLSFGVYVVSSIDAVSRVYTVVTTYLEADIAGIRYAQSADVLFLAHRLYPERQIARIADTNWTITDVVYGPLIAGPTGIKMSAGVAGTTLRTYRVTTIAKETLEESLVGTYKKKTVTGATNATPIVITVATHGFVTGDQVLIEDVTGNTAANDKWLITVLGVNTFELDGSIGNGAYAGGGTAARTALVTGTPTVALPNTITWDVVPNSQQYFVYRRKNGIFGFIGVSGDESFDDTNIDPDSEEQPPYDRDLFNATGEYPNCIALYQQRMMLAGADLTPESAYGSRIGNFLNFTGKFPITDNSAVTFQLAGKEVNRVLHMAESVGKLIMFTQGAEILIEGNNSGTLTPTGINARQQTAEGISELPPIAIGRSLIYVQSRGNLIRDFAFDNFNAAGYEGIDMTIFGSHLFEGHTIVSWAYQRIPHSVLWAVRDDGILLGCTYIKDHQILAWHRHDTDGGLVERVSTVPEGSEDAVYIVVKREIPGLASLGGSTRRYVERLTSRFFDDIVNYVGMDCSLGYDGRNPVSPTSGIGPGACVLTGGTNWDYTETLTLTASDPFFLASMIGDELWLQGTDGTVIKFTITGFTSSLIVTGNPNMNVPVGMQSPGAVIVIALATDEIGGLWHIEGEYISVLGDGEVQGSPNNVEVDLVQIVNGKATLNSPSAVIQAGLPFLPDIETLDIDPATGETLVDRNKNVTRVVLSVEKSRGIWTGPKPPSDDSDDPLEGLIEAKIRANEDYADPVRLATENVPINLQSEWNSNGRVFIRQVDPLPLTILAIAPAGFVPARGG